ncbi:ImmA/IrrE family metallo-endopeptidase [Peribacillus sp. NPDC096379]|uniref:ImmA/IrrE family metallo-endopeptidase n=1 Tax=Peribacillus sp. NPDC096379 TaxID=3364393 RepID=UPI0037F7FCC6
MGWIKEKVIELTKKYDTRDPFELASCLNGFVFEWDFHEEINGVYKYDKRNKYIYINSNLTSNNKLFTCTHELGHVVLHPRANTPFMRKNTLLSVDKIEKEANRFAVELLVPDNVICDYKDSSISIHKICEQYSVPKELAYIKKFNY